jgi:hypothetical protein
MTDDPVPDDVRRFILEHIDSVAQLEALLLLRKHGERSWSAQDVAGRLYIGAVAAGDILAQLAGEGLCATGDGFYRYEPGDADRRILIDRLANTYALYLIAVTNLIHEKPLRIRQFADAFKFRKDK